MAQVSAAILAIHLGTAAVGVGACADVVDNHRIGEGGPTGSGIKLCVGTEKGRPARLAAVHAFFMIVDVGAGERSFGAALAKDMIFLGRQFLLPILLVLFHRLKRIMRALVASSMPSR